MSEYTPTEARLRERVKGSLGEYAHEFGIDGEAAMDEWIDRALAERDNQVRADERAKLQDRIEELEKNLSYEVEQKIKLADTLRDERAKRPDREQVEAAVKRGLQAYYDHEPTGEDDPTEPEHLVTDAVLSSLALEPEAREEPKHGLIEDYTAAQAPDWTKVSGKLDAHDDQVDALTQALTELRDNGKGAVTPAEGRIDRHLARAASSGRSRIVRSNGR